jgi:hypothetical protein
LLAISIVLLVILDDNIPSSHLILNIGIAFWADIWFPYCGVYNRD